MARVRLKRDPSLGGRQLTTAGLFIGYVSLLLSILFLATRVYADSRKTVFIRKEADVLAVMAARGVDQVKPGDHASEQAHQLKARNSQTGEFYGRRWRAAGIGGEFSYVMKVLPDQPMSLNCRYWGSDLGGRVFDVLVNGKVIAVQELNMNMPERFFDVEYKIPRKLTEGQNEVTVEFRARPGKVAGGVFGCQMLRQ